MFLVKSVIYESIDGNFEELCQLCFNRYCSLDLRRQKLIPVVTSATHSRNFQADAVHMQWNCDNEVTLSICNTWVWINTGVRMESGETDWVRVGFPNYDVANMRIQREGLGKRCPDTGRPERHIQKSCVIEEDFPIRMSKWSLIYEYILLMLLYHV